MNQEIYPQVYRTTETMGVDQTPTPIKGHVSKHEDGSYYITAEGADGQQVADLITTALRQMPENRRTNNNGFFEFAFGLLFISFVTVAIVNIFFLANPPQPTINQIKQNELLRRPKGDRTMKRCVFFLILGIVVGVWSDRTIRNTLSSLPLPDFAKAPIIEIYGK